MMKYLCFYDTLNNNENRASILAATNKIDYVCDSLNCESITLISAAYTKNKKGYYPSRIELINKKVGLILFPTFGTSSKPSNLIKYLFTKLNLFIYLLRHCQKNETIIVYHSPFYIDILILLKKIKKINIILQAEEIYGNVSHQDWLVKKELKLFNISSSFIFPTNLLSEKYNHNQKPFVLSHGVYKSAIISNKKWDDYIHLVYSGTFDPKKGGVFQAIKACLDLDERYYMHILGFGHQQDKVKVEELIQQTKTKTRCKISYDGLLSGKEYTDFLQKCHIGISSQFRSTKLTDTSFPSKILTYFANNLHVVSIRIKALESSKLNDLIVYYDDDDYHLLANAIKKVNLIKPINYAELLTELDIEFKNNLNELVSFVNTNN